MEFLTEVWTFLGNLHWGRVFVTVAGTLVAVVVGIWFPAKMLEAHTNQPLARWAWYIVGTLALAMVYISMYGYGHFWELYAESEETQEVAPLNPGE